MRTGTKQFHILNAAAAQHHNKSKRYIMKQQISISTDTSGPNSNMTRRQALMKLGLAATAMYAAPLLTTMSEAQAKSGSSGKGSSGNSGSSGSSGGSSNSGRGGGSRGSSGNSGGGGRGGRLGRVDRRQLRSGGRRSVVHLVVYRGRRIRKPRRGWSRPRVTRQTAVRSRERPGRSPAAPRS